MSLDFGLWRPPGCVREYDCGVASVTDLLERVNEKLDLVKDEVKPTQSRIKKVFKWVGSPARRELVVSLLALLNDLKTELVAQHATTQEPAPLAMSSTGVPAGELAAEDIEAIYEILDLIRFKSREGQRGSRLERIFAAVSFSRARGRESRHKQDERRDYERERGGRDLEVARAMLAASIPLVARDEYLYRSLVAEGSTLETDHPEWSELYGFDSLASLMTQYSHESRLFEPPSATQARTNLLELYRQRRIAAGRQRVHASTRQRYLLYLTIPVLSFAVVLAFADAMLEEPGFLSWQIMLLVLAAGAVGGTISGAIRLRGLDTPDLFRFFGSFMAQVSIGAAVAAVVVVAFQATDFVTSADTATGDGAAKWISLGFAAGFSEPFTLRVVARVVGAPTKDIPAPTSARNTGDEPGS